MNPMPQMPQAPQMNPIHQQSQMPPGKGAVLRAPAFKRASAPVLPPRNPVIENQEVDSPPREEWKQPEDFHPKPSFSSSSSGSSEKPLFRKFKKFLDEKNKG